MANSAKSIPILQLSGSRINIDVPNILKILDLAGNRPLVIHSINGKSRQGKSLMMNFFLQHLRNNDDSNSEEWFNPSELQQDFVWEGGANRITEGINAWSQPFFRTINGREVAIILLDTQGAFDDTTSFQQNAIIFAVSALLSSTMIWNQMGDISEDVLQFFLCFVGFATLACDDPQNADTELRHSFQKLVFLLRDFAYSREFPFGYHSDFTNQDRNKNYKMAKLNPNGSRDQSLNFIRQQIHASFEEVGIFALPRPGDDLIDHDRLDSLKENFKLYTKEFVELMFSDGTLRRTKHVGGIEVTGETFKEFVRQWARHFDSSDLPDLKDFLQTSIEIQYTLAIKQAIVFYEAAMKKVINLYKNGLGNVELRTVHDQIVLETVKVFMNLRKLGGPDHVEQYKRELLENLQRRLEYFEQINQVNLNTALQEQRFQQEMKGLNSQILINQEIVKNLTTNSEADRRAAAIAIKDAKRRTQEIRDEMERQHVANAAEIARLNDIIANTDTGRRCSIL